MIIYEYFLISVIFYLRLTLPGFNLKISIVRVDLDTQIAVGCPTSPAKSTAKLKSKSEKIGPMRNVALYAPISKPDLSRVVGLLYLIIKYLELTSLVGHKLFCKLG